MSAWVGLYEGGGGGRGMQGAGKELGAATLCQHACRANVTAAAGAVMPSCAGLFRVRVT